MLPSPTAQPTEAIKKALLDVQCNPLEVVIIIFPSRQIPIYRCLQVLNREAQAKISSLLNNPGTSLK
jgi:hypothetical protein